MQTFDIVLPSALFPFRLADLPDFMHGRYRLQNVFGAITPPQQQACVELWLRHGAVAAPRAGWDRSREACYLMRDADSGRLVGVNTLYPDRLDPSGPRYYFNRMFIHPQHRHGRLMVVATAATLCWATRRLADGEMPGIVNINENRKLARPGMRRIFARLGYRRQGERDGQDVWYFEFAAARISERPPGA